MEGALEGAAQAEQILKPPQRACPAPCASARGRPPDRREGRACQRGVHGRTDKAIWRRQEVGGEKIGRTGGWEVGEKDRENIGNR
eukprot:366497-Chlamydomonas_euryale.AAC.10